jgi:hypothetical protein
MDKGLKDRLHEHIMPGISTSDFYMNFISSRGQEQLYFIAVQIGNSKRWKNSTYTILKSINCNARDLAMLTIQ